MATSKAKPVLASHAEKARSKIGEDEKLVESRESIHKDKAINSESIIPSKHSRADKRWVRWKANPARPTIKAEEKAN